MFVKIAEKQVCGFFRNSRQELTRFLHTLNDFACQARDKIPLPGSFEEVVSCTGDFMSLRLDPFVKHGKL